MEDRHRSLENRERIVADRCRSVQSGIVRDRYRSLRDRYRIVTGSLEILRDRCRSLEIVTDRCKSCRIVTGCCRSLQSSQNSPQNASEDTFKIKGRSAAPSMDGCVVLVQAEAVWLARSLVGAVGPSSNNFRIFNLDFEGVL